MFTLIQAFDNITLIHQHPLGLIICSENEGISIYRQGQREQLHGTAPFYACIFQDTLLFQRENGGGISYLKMEGDRFTEGAIGGSFYLHAARTDDADIYIPFKGGLHQFNSDLEPVQRFNTGKVPYAVHKGLYYRLNPHFSCFSLQTNEKVWEIADDDMLEKNTVMSENFIALRDDLLIARTKVHDYTNALIAYNADDGSIAWQREDYIPAMRFLKGSLYSFYYNSLPQLKGRLLIADEKNGRTIQDADVTEVCRQHDVRTADQYFMTADDTHIYLAGIDGRAVYALNASSFDIDWQHRFEGPVSWLSDIKIQDNHLFITDDRKKLYVFKRD